MNFKPHSYQQSIIERSYSFYQNNQRGKLILPCGAGKTLTSIWMLKEILIDETDPLVLIFLPRLDLVCQYEKAFSKEYSHHHSTPWKKLIAACDFNPSQHDKNSLSSNVSLDPIDWENFVLGNNNIDITSICDPKIIFVTFQSALKLISVLSNLNACSTFSIVDEAHLTAGDKAKDMSKILDPFTTSNVLQRILFLTATERMFEPSIQRKHPIHCMSDPKVYGEYIDKISFRNLLELGKQDGKQYIVDYKLHLFVGKKDNLSSKEEKFNSALRMLSETYQKNKVSHTIAYCQTLKEAKRHVDWISNNDVFNDVKVFFICGKNNVKQRNYIFEEYKNASKALIFNSKLLRFGVDLPITNGIAFLCDVKSAIDIQQIIMRGCRPYPDKKHFNIFVPTTCSKYFDYFDNNVDDVSFSKIKYVLETLCSIDPVFEKEAICYFANKENKSRIVTSNENIDECFITEEMWDRWMKNLKISIMTHSFIQDKVWQNNYEALMEYVQSEEKFPQYKSDKIRKLNIGHWIWKQCDSYKKSNLSDRKIYLLENLDGWNWKKPMRKLTIHEQQVLNNLYNLINDHPNIKVETEEKNVFTLVDLNNGDKVNILLLASQADYGQLAIYPTRNSSDKIVWKSLSSPKIKYKQQVKNLYEDILSNINVFNGKIEPFFDKNTLKKKSITPDEWKTLRDLKSNGFDQHIPINDNIRALLLTWQDFHYVQIKGKGLYSLHNSDPLRLDVPYFDCDQYLRIRIKQQNNKSKFVAFSAQISSGIKYKSIKPSSFSFLNS